MRVHGLAVCTPHRSIVPAINMNRRLTLQQCIFVYKSLSRVCTEYIQTFPGEVPPSRLTIHEIVKKFETPGSVANKKRDRKHTVLTAETLYEIGASLERTPTKSIPKLAQQVRISESSPHRATKLLKLKPYYSVFPFLQRVVYKLSSEVGCGELTNPK